MAFCSRTRPPHLLAAGKRASLAVLAMCVITSSARADDAPATATPPASSAPAAEVAAGAEDTAHDAASIDAVSNEAPAASGPTDAPELSAPDARPEGSFRAHGEQQHEGFFLRLTAGAGAGTATYREPVNGKEADVQTRGLTGLLEVAAGYTVVEHLILHGNALVAGFGDARRTVNGLPDASKKPTTTTTMLGGGASYYFPLNVYVTGSIGVAWFDESRSGEHFRTGTGFGFSVATGKEWWVGRSGEWGIGAALRAVVTTGAAELSGEHTRVHTGHIGVAVSATLN